MRMPCPAAVVRCQLLTTRSCSGIFVGIASCILFSSLVFAKWLDRHTHPQQRVVCLGIATLTTTSALAVVMVAWEEGGLWAHGDVVLIIGLIVNFVSTIQLILWLASAVSNEGRSSPLLVPLPPFLGPGFRLGARWNRLGEAVKTRSKNGGKRGENGRDTA